MKKVYIVNIVRGNIAEGYNHYPTYCFEDELKAIEYKIRLESLFKKIKEHFKIGNYSLDEDGYDRYLDITIGSHKLVNVCCEEFITHTNYDSIRVSDKIEVINMK